MLLRREHRSRLWMPFFRETPGIFFFLGSVLIIEFGPQLGHEMIFEHFVFVREQLEIVGLEHGDHKKHGVHPTF